MERSRGCCVARYSMHKIDRIMLKYRPIAPKPPTGGSVSGSSSSSPESGDHAYVKIGRGKRKYARDSSSNRRRKAVVTLPLLPETPEPKEEKNGPIWLSFSGEDTEKKDKREICKSGVEDMGASYVTVECVTETWTEGEGAGVRNEERVMRLEKDTCPGMITDGDNRVLWVNKAYREMVGQGEGAVFVMMKQWVRLPSSCPAFTCRVRWSMCRKGKKPLTLPCDVWKMKGVGYAWRLDVKAALCLALDFIQ